MASFSIEIGGHQLKLSEGTTLPVNIKSGWFTREWNYDYTYPLTVPLSVNKNAFGIIENEAYEVVGRQYKGVMDIGSTRREVLVDVLTVREYDDDVEISIFFNRIEIPLLWENLRDIDLPVELDTIEAQYSNAINNIYPDTEYYFPHVLNTEFYDDSSTDDAQKKAPFFFGNINQFAGGNMFRENTQNIITGATVNRNTLCPFPSVHAVIRRIFEKSGFRVGGSFMQDDDQKRLFTANNNSLDIVEAEPWEDITASGSGVQGFDARNTIITPHFPGYTSTNEPTYFDVTNPVFSQFIPGGSGIYKIDVTERILPHVPVVTMVQLRIRVVESGTNNLVAASSPQTITAFSGLQGFDVQFNIELTITPAMVSQPLSFEIEVLDYTERTEPGTFNVNLMLSRKQIHIYRYFETPLVKFRPVARLNDHLPDLTFADFLEEIMEQFTLRRRIDYINRTIYLDYATDELSKNPTPINARILSPGKEIQFEKIRKVAYQYHYRDEEDANTDGFNEVYRNIPVIERNDIQYRTEILDDTVDEVVELKTHPLYTVNSIFVAFNERGISAPLEVSGRISPIRLGYFAGRLSNGRPYARNEYGIHSLVASTQGISWAYRKLLWEIATLQDPRTYRLPMLINLANFESIDVDAVVSIDNSKYIIDEIDGDIEQEGEIQATFTLKRI